MKARLLLAALCAGFLVLGRTAPARAQGDSVLVRVGTNISGRAGDYIDVPIIVDLTGAPGRSLGSYTATLSFNPALLSFDGAGNGDFAAPQTNTNHALDSGTVRFTAIQPSGALGAVVLFYARFHVVSDTAQSPVAISFSEMSATATSVTPFESLLPLLRIVPGTFCKSLGRWGDVNGDGQANSFDALVALSVVVGIEVDQPGLNPALADVDGDGKVTSRDALIILSYSVGLPVTGYRVLLNAPGACGASSPITIVINPDSLELQVGQTAGVVFAALDSLGHSVSTDGGTVTSSNPSVAAWVNMEGGGAVQARAAGVAILTARLGPGVAATFKVVVLARRTKWYVDVLRASLAPTQLGDSVLPFEFIGDALNLAHNGDTVLVATGTYEEVVSADVAVTILGDSTTARPILDPRGASYWSSSGDALDLEPGASRILLAHLVVRAGRTFLAAHDITVRDVRIEGLNTYPAALLEMETAPPYEDAPPARAAGPQRSYLPQEPGNVLVDGVVVVADSANYGILVDLADTAVIRNSAVRRTQQGPSPSCGAGPYTYGGIVVQQASVSLVQNDTVVNPQCQGIALFDNNSTPLLSDFSRATATHNVVSNAPGTGIALGARLVTSDHNVVSNTGRVPGQSSYGSSVGIVASYYDVSPDTVWSLGDNIVGSGGRGFVIDTAAKGVIDSLIVSGAGLDSSYYGYGVYLGPGGTYWLSHSRITNTVYTDGVSFAGEHTSLHSHGNYIFGAGEYGLTSYYNCDCAPPARGAPAPGGTAGPQRDGSYTGGPDTLISVSDTIRGSSMMGVFLRNGVYALLDSAVIDSAGQNGVYLDYVSRGTISHSSVSRGSTGIYAYYVDTLTLLGDSVLSNGGEGLDVDNYGSPDSTRIIGSTFAANGAEGVYLDYANARMDSSVAINNGTGLYIDNGSGARVRWTRFQTNNIGMVMANGSSSSSVVSSNFISDTTAGVQNNADGPMLTADTNYWGDSRGPRCTFGCDPLSVGDSVFGSVTFADWLTTNAPTLSPPLHLAAIAARTPKPARAALSRPADGRAVQVAPRPPLADRASRIAADAAAVAQRSQHQRPAAWHAPSKAKTHAVQIIVKKRT